MVSARAASGMTNKPAKVLVNEDSREFIKGHGIRQMAVLSEYNRNYSCGNINGKFPKQESRIH